MAEEQAQLFVDLDITFAAFADVADPSSESTVASRCPADRQPGLPARCGLLRHTATLFANFQPGAARWTRQSRPSRTRWRSGSRRSASPPPSTPSWPRPPSPCSTSPTTPPRARAFGGPRAGFRPIPERHRNNVVLRNRGPGTRRRAALDGASAVAQPSGGATPLAAADRFVGGQRGKSCGRTRVPARNGCFSGHSPTSATSWSCSANASCHCSMVALVDVHVTPRLKLARGVVRLTPSARSPMRTICDH